MSEQIDLSDAHKWKCARCDTYMGLRKVMVSYMGSAFPVDLPVCPKCGQVYVPESLALGRMAEVEKALEDK